MLRRFGTIGLVLAALLLSSTVHAQGPGTKHSDSHWQASYWNNMALAGPPLLEETVENLAYDWGYGSPHPSINPDQFSVRWSRTVDLAEADYRFSVTSDDGVRVYVDDRLIIDQWRDQAARTFSSDLALQAGHHQIMVEYYENTGVAKVALSWAPLSDWLGRWHGEFYDNPTLSGSPVGTRSDAEIDFDWGYGKVGPGGPTDDFSIRWTRTIPFEAGAYRFTATSDDGIRVYVDGRLIIDQWYDHAVQTYRSELNLAGGPHELVVEYYEHTGVAVVRFSWTRLPGGVQGWDAAYYGNRWLGGTPILTRGEENIDFDWGTGSPGAGIPSDGFSARWTRTAHFEDGMYRFTATTDDGVRLWVNGHLLIDEWRDQWFQPHAGDIHLSGDVPIVMEYYENGGAAAARLGWTRIGGGPVPPAPGEVVVDDGSVGFTQGGSPTAWRTATGGYGGGLTWTRNNDRARANYNWARWYADLEPGRYEVYVYVPEQHATTSQARYWVAHYDGYTLRRVNQATNGGQWVSLGTYRFRSGCGSYVSLADVTYESYLSSEIAFDAVKWVSR